MESNAFEKSMLSHAPSLPVFQMCCTSAGGVSICLPMINPAYWLGTTNHIRSSNTSNTASAVSMCP